MLLPIAAATLALVPFILTSDSASSVTAAKLCTFLYLVIRLVPLLVRLSGIAIGKNIRARTQQRREALLARAEQDEKDFNASRKKTEDEDWEKVGSRSSGSSTPGDQQDKDWQGVIGFFHPFW